MQNRTLGTSVTTLEGNILIDQAAIDSQVIQDEAQVTELIKTGKREEAINLFCQLAKAGRYSVPRLSSTIRATYPDIELESPRFLQDQVIISYLSKLLHGDKSVQESLSRYMTMIQRDINDLPAGWQWESATKFLLKQTQEA